MGKVGGGGGKGWNQVECSKVGICVLEMSLLANVAVLVCVKNTLQSWLLSKLTKSLSAVCLYAVKLESVSLKCHFWLMLPSLFVLRTRLRHGY